MMHLLACLAAYPRQLDMLTTPAELCRFSAAFIVQSLQLPDNVIYLKNRQQRLHQVAASGGKFCATNGVVSPLQLEVGEGVVGLAAQCRSSLNIQDTSALAHYVVDDMARPAELAVPLHYQGDLLGVIDAEHPQAGFFTPEHQYFVEAVAAVLAPRLAGVTGRGRRNRDNSIRPEAGSVSAAGWLTEAEFSRLLQRVLKYYFQPQQWQRELSALACCAVTGTTTDGSLIGQRQCLQHLIAEQVARMQAIPATELRARLLNDRYLHNCLGQLVLADQYHMSFSSLRRLQDQAVQHLISQLWQQELQARQLH